MPSKRPEDLHDSIEAKAVAAVKAMDAAVKLIKPSLAVRMICTGRSNEEQRQMYAKKVSKILENGAHNTDLPETKDFDSEAFDIGVFDGAKYLQGNTKWEVELYDTCGQIGKAYGFVWGGDWKTLVDKPHFERPNWRNLK